MVSRGDIWLVLSDTADAKAEPHPCVVMSPPEIHDHLGVVTVAPVVRDGRPASFRVAFQFNAQPRLILLEQLRTIDRRALTRQVGAIERKTLDAALAILREMFAE